MIRTIILTLFYAILVLAVQGQSEGEIKFEEAKGICAFESNGFTKVEGLGFEILANASIVATRKVKMFHSSQVVVIRPAKKRLNLDRLAIQKEIRGFLSSGHTTGKHPNRRIPVLYFNGDFREIGDAFYEAWPCK